MKLYPLPVIPVHATTRVEHDAASDDNGYGQRIPPSVYVLEGCAIPVWIEWDPEPIVLGWPL